MEELERVNPEKGGDVSFWRVLSGDRRTLTEDGNKNIVCRFYGSFSLSFCFLFLFKELEEIVSA